ncbi:MAG: YIP1 family protein [Deltaproteobacteria bacterium]|nr:YIP1 family protein [Deltaproteobacteria bacterium]
MGDAEFSFQQGPKAFVQVWRKVMLDSRGFYRDTPLSGGFENPLIFLALCVLVYFVLKVIVSGFADAVNALFLIALTYVFGPGILMLACQFLFQGEGDYEGTFRVCAYAGACHVLAWIPVLGLFAYLYGFYLIFLGTEKVHKLDTTKAAIATLVAILVTAAILFFVLGEERIRRPLL